MKCNENNTCENVLEILKECRNLSLCHPTAVISHIKKLRSRKIEWLVQDYQVNWGQSKN